MDSYAEQTAGSKHRSLTTSPLSPGAGKNAVSLVDNRPQAIAHRKLQETISSSAMPVVQREKTVSGHGGIRTDHLGNPSTFNIPNGQTIMLSAPPGATLGDISLVLNTTAAPTAAAMRLLIKVNTTEEIWANTVAMNAILADASIPKTALQQQILGWLIAGTNTYAGLTAGQKGSLSSLEKKAQFETWADNYVKPSTFQEITGTPLGTTMYDMDITPFGANLRSPGSAAQNEYVNAATTLSAYTQANAGENRIVVNACSHGLNLPFTGFQIDRL